MLTKRPANERGHADHGWLDTYHSFSFAQYNDPNHMGFRSLRVINDDVIAGGAGFPAHPHENMEILTYVLEGALEHRDSTGGGGVLRPGDVQHMTAGSGIRHSEFNASRTESLRLLQIWVHPSEQNLEPRYQDRTFPADGKRGRLQLIASPGGRDGSLSIHASVEVFAVLLSRQDKVTHFLRPGRHAWVQVTDGAVIVNGEELQRGDGLAVSDEDELVLRGRGEGGELLLFDLE